MTCRVKWRQQSRVTSPRFCKMLCFEACIEEVSLHHTLSLSLIRALPLHLILSALGREATVSSKSSSLWSLDYRKPSVAMATKIASPRSTWIILRKFFPFWSIYNCELLNIYFSVSLSVAIWANDLSLPLSIHVSVMVAHHVFIHCTSLSLRPAQRRSLLSRCRVKMIRFPLLTTKWHSSSWPPLFSPILMKHDTTCHDMSWYDMLLLSSSLLSLHWFLSMLRSTQVKQNRFLNSFYTCYYCLFFLSSFFLSYSFAARLVLLLWSHAMVWIQIKHVCVNLAPCFVPSRLYHP